MDLYKECSKCKTNLNIIEFHNCKGGKFGKHSICKVCRKVKKELSIPITDYKLCPKCNTRKGIIDFYECNLSNCKDCHKYAISQSLSKLEPYLNMLYKKFVKKHNKKLIDFGICDLVYKYKSIVGICEISGITMEHIVNSKQQFDNIWNIAILYNESNKNSDNIIEIDDIQLVCHLAKTMKCLYKMDDGNIKTSIDKMKG
tara:strand:+ start:2455 stop:3054 length:600 start_codon:yes stop_codon:yes gene_type:complete